MSWPEVPIGEIFEVARGGSPRPIDKFITDDPDGLNWVMIGDATASGKYINETKKKIRPEGLKKTREVEPGDFILSNSMSFGKPYIMGIKGCIHDGWLLLRPQSDQIYPDYFYHLLGSDPVYQKFASRAAGATVKNLNSSIVREMEIPLPPLEEQKRIAGILDQAAELCRLRTHALDKLNTLGQAIFHEMFGDPVDNPKGFPRKKLLEIVDIIGGSQPAKKHFLYDDGPGRVRFVQTRDFRTDAYKTYVSEDLAKRPFSEDDVIIGRYGPPVFQIFRGLAGTYNVALMKAQPIGEITKDFVFYLLQEPKLHGYVVANSERTAGQSGVNLDLLKDYLVYAPPIELQTDFSQRLTEVDTVTRNARRQNLKAQTLFASLQHRAFRGEL